MKTNIATDYSQSQRLLRCGVSADTADMCWIAPDRLVTGGVGFPTLMCAEYFKHDDSIHQTPAWSLSALLSIMPDLEHCFSLWKFEEDDTYAADATMVNPDFRVDANDPIEACVGLIEILHANGYKFNEI